MKVVRFINKIFDETAIINLEESSGIFRYHKIYFEINNNYYSLSEDVAKTIFTKRYAPLKYKNQKIDSFFPMYFDTQVLLINENLLKEKNIIFVSAMQILFDKLIYFDINN